MSKHLDAALATLDRALGPEPTVAKTQQVRRETVLNTITVTITTEPAVRPKPTRIYREWLDRLASGRLTKAQIQQVYNTIWPLASGEQHFGKRTLLTVAEAQDLRRRIDVHPEGFRLDRDHIDQGITWLRNLRPKALKAQFPEWADNVYDFRFIGVHEVARNAWRTQRTPLYLAIAPEGKFEYAFSGWQSGTSAVYVRRHG